MQQNKEEITKLQTKLKEAQDLAIKRGEIQVRLTKENMDFRKALRETREALANRVDEEIEAHHCKYCGGWEHVGEAIRHEKDCPIAILAKYAPLAEEADHG